MNNSILRFQAFLLIDKLILYLHKSKIKKVEHFKCLNIYKLHKKSQNIVTTIISNKENIW